MKITGVWVTIFPPRLTGWARRVCAEPGAGTDGHLRGEPLPTVADLRRYQQEAKEVRDFQAVEIELYIRTV